MPEKFTPQEALTYIPERYRRDESLFVPGEYPLNIDSNSYSESARMLSNFAEAPFTLDGIEYASVEGFIQSLKFSEPGKQELVAGMYSYSAKKEGRKVKDAIKEAYAAESSEEPVGYVTNYQDIQIPYRSPEHYDLIARAIRAKFDQNTKSKAALIKTYRTELTHDLGHPESPTTSLPAEVFTTILMRLRQEYQLADLRNRASVNDITYHLNQNYRDEMDRSNPVFLQIQKEGYRSVAISWLKSLTPKEMKFGKATEDERWAQARHFAELTGVSLDVLAREAGLVKLAQ